jgi:hypothetical protein
MIKSYSALSSISTDYELFLDDIKGGLNFPKCLLKNSVAFVSCNRDFISNGYYKKLHEDLNITIIGQISKAMSCYLDQSTFGFNITVLTSDTACFTVSLTDSITNNLEGALQKSYDDIKSIHKIKPGMLLFFAPFTNYSGDLIVETITKITDSIPLFGSISLQDENSFMRPDSTGIFYNSEYSNDKCTYIAISDTDFSPKFYFTSVSKNVIGGDAHKVTSSSGSIVHSIDNIEFTKFLKKFGQIPDLNSGIAPYFLFLIQSLVDSNTLISRTLINGEFNGSGIFSGEFRDNDLLFLGYLTKDEVIVTTKETYLKAFSNEDITKNVIAFSCLTRNTVLGFEPFQEFEIVKTALGKNDGYSVCSAGGEFCPLYDKNNKYINYFHNSSHIICVF